MEFLISASQALNSINLRLKTDWKTNLIVDNQMLYKEFPKLYKISLKVLYWKKTGHVDTLSRT